MSTSLIIAIIVVISVLSILFVISEWKVFRKAGKPGWASIIPLYSGWTLAEVGGKPAWWGLLAGFSLSVRVSGAIPFGLVVAICLIGAVLFMLWLLILR